MTKIIHAIYENGVFRPIEPVNLPDHTAVEIELRVEEGMAGRQPGEGFLRTEGALADDPYWDGIMEEVHHARCGR